MPVPAGETDTRPRRRIGRYVVTGRIGKGGMGMVYRGLDEALEREVAIKTLTVEGTFDEESRKRFEIEAKAAAKLQHPNILTVFELGEDRGVPFIAMELLPGADLEALLRSGEALLLQEKLEIVIQVCRGLAYAHEHRIVHRDIKPSNIRVLDDGTAKIMDFGIAKLQGMGVTKAGMMVGTVHYMSPEQIQGKPLDGRSDVFSVGVILYELVAGKRPFPGESATEILYKIVQSPPAPLPGLPPEAGAAGPPLQRILDRALAKSPEERYPGAGRLADDLAEVVASLPRSGGAPEPAQETIQLSRRLLKEGRAEESVRRLRELVERAPDSIELRRVLRTATRELQRREHAVEPAADDFPELDVTFQAAPTRISPETATELQPTELRPPPPAPAVPMRARGTGLLVAAGLALLAALAAGVLLLRGGRVAPPAPGSETLRVPVRSEPPGATVLLDGQETGVQTDGELTLPASRRGQVLLTFRKAGHRDESRTVTLPLPAGEAVVVTLGRASVSVPVASDPPGASVSLDGGKAAGATPLELVLDPAVEHRIRISLDGYAPQEVRVGAGPLPVEVRVSLEPAGPAGTVNVVSSYPVDVLWRGRVLARGQVSPRVSVPQGRQQLTLVGASVFLKTTTTVDVRAESGLQAPPLGRINIKASPENCEVFIDGVSAGYLPILDKPIVAGTHAVLFKWPDGGRQEQSVEVPAGGPAYAMGRKD